MRSFPSGGNDRLPPPSPLPTIKRQSRHVLLFSPEHRCGRGRLWPSIEWLSVPISEFPPLRPTLHKRGARSSAMSQNYFPLPKSPPSAACCTDQSFIRFLKVMCSTVNKSLSRDIP